MKKLLKSLPYLLIAILVGTTAVYAGNLTPPGAPAKTMKSLSDLYELIDTGANTPSTDFTTPSTIFSTMNSLNDIYNLMVDKISDIDPATILTGTSIFGVEGEATAGIPAPTFAELDAMTYSCEALTLDPSQPDVTLETICGYHSGDGCSWSGSACIGGTKTPTDGYMTWYAGTASCSEKIDEGSTSWRLATYPELVRYYLEYNNAGAPPDGFVGVGYWSGITLPSYSDSAYGLNMSLGYAGIDSKNNPNNLVHCVH